MRRLFIENADIVGDPKVSAHMRREHQVRYELTLPYAQGKTVLDLGCGYGYCAAMLAQTAKAVTGVDLNSQAIDVARDRYRHVTNLEFIQANILDFLEATTLTFDIVVLFEVIEHVEAQEELLRRIWQATKEGGRLFLSTPNRLKTPFYRKNPYHVRELSPDELREIVGKRFPIDLVKGQILGLWAFFPQSFVAPVTSKLGIHERVVRLNDRPKNSMTLVVSGVRKAAISPTP